jgi:hypothetical protein
VEAMRRFNLRADNLNVRFYNEFLERKAYSGAADKICLIFFILSKLLKMSLMCGGWIRLTIMDAGGRI